MFKKKCKINRLLQSIVYLSLSHISLSFAQTYNLGTNLLKLTSLSDSVSKINSPEKPYLQFDKPYYAQGDTIWFKAYLFNSYMAASNKSSLLNIDIANDSNKIVKQLRIPVNNSIGWGSINLNEKEFASGTYTIRAYTNWMLNFGNDYFFYKSFYITSPIEDKWLVNREINLITDSGLKKASIKLQFTDMAKKFYQVKDINLQVLNGGKRMYRQKFLTDLNGSIALNFALPQKNNDLSILVEDLLKEKKAVIPLPLNRPENIDLQFLPEGGSLVAGLPSYVGFKAIGEDGKGVFTSGIITDNENNNVAAFSSLHDGMGNVYLAPKIGESYIAKVNLPGGVVKNYPLPAIKTSGMVLHIKNRAESDSLDVLVTWTPDIAITDDNYYLIGRARGIVCYAGVFSLKNTNFIKQKIPKSLFPTGIVHFTVMTPNNQPINERVVYIERHDRLNIQITTDKPNYTARDSVSVKIKVTDKNGNPITGNFSMSVTDDAQVKQDALNRENILTRMLLTSNLKGFIEEPEYYLNNKSDTAWQALDNLLLTQGWVDYDWKQVFNPLTITYQPESEFKVNGSVKNVFNKPVKGSNILLFSNRPSIFLDTITDQNGKFVFDRLPKIDTPVFFLKAVNRSGKSFNIIIGIDEIKTPDFIKPFGPKTTPWYIDGDSILLNYTKTRASLGEMENLAKGSNLLKEVKIKAKKIIKGSQNLNGPGEADQVIDEKDLEKAGKKTLLQLLQERVKGFGDKYFNRFSLTDKYLWEYVSDMHTTFEWYSVDGKPVKFIVDGESAALAVSPPSTQNSFIDIKNFLTGILAEDIKGIEINHSTKYTLSYFSRFDPADLIIQAMKKDSTPYFNISSISFIEITTRSGHGPYLNNTPGRYLYKPLPISWPVAFYKPKYLVKDITKHTPDLRSTISWEPNIVTDNNGEAKIWFYTADKPTTYSLILEGSDMNGNIGFKIDKINNIKLENKTK